MANNGGEGFSGVSKCYFFKSQLQEYSQKAGLLTPIYETVKEGPSHQPSFRSTVIVNDVRYDSLPGFFNRKAAEQSAAEVALLELSKSAKISNCVSLPVHETGLCKNLLQEYSQKMNFAIPLYLCHKEESSGRRTLFTCSVEIGGVCYIGGSAGTKKEAEIKAARTALLAIQSSASESSGSEPQLTVLPSKKRGPQTANDSASRDADDAPRPKKKARKKKKGSKRKSLVRNAGNSQDDSAEGKDSGNLKSVEEDVSSVPVVEQNIDQTSHSQPGGSGVISGEMETCGVSVYHAAAADGVHILVNHDTPVIISTAYGDITAFLNDVPPRAGETGYNFQVSESF